VNQRGSLPYRAQALAAALVAAALTLLTVASPAPAKGSSDALAKATSLKRSFATRSRHPACRRHHHLRCPSTHRRPPQKPTGPVWFDLFLSLSGSYTYHYTAPSTDDQKFIDFTTGPRTIEYAVLMYPTGQPPKFLRNDVPSELTPFTLGLSGTWGETATGNGDSCKVNGSLAEGQPQTLGAHASYGIRHYDLVLHFASGGFTYTGTEPNANGGPCSTTDPWHDWVPGPDSGQEVPDAALTLPQAKLQAALRGAHPSIPVHLPGWQVGSSDCGSTPDLGIACTQDLNWTGKVIIEKAKKQKP
jgi:hypothetical protein